MAEKLRAGAIRKIIAPRDFYDIDFVLRNKFDLINNKVMKLFKKKLQEDNADTDPGKYRKNLGRTEEEMRDMNSRIENELFDVITPEERKNFDLSSALTRINKLMENVKQQ